jgi:adenine-specific DNA-methyltransferase
MVKCLHLEQYEDTLNNIVFKESDKTVQQTLSSFEDYFLRYMLDYETKESPTRIMVDKFSAPFDYKVLSCNGTEEKAVSIDLIETFNYLLGLTVEKLQYFVDNERIYRVVFGKLENQSVCVIWRDLEQIDLEKDKQFIESKILASKNFDFIYVNGDSYVKNARPIEPEFKRLMGA